MLWMYACIHTSPHHDWNGLFKDYYQVLNTYQDKWANQNFNLIQFATLETNSINMLQDVCCLISPICKYQKPLGRLPLEFFLILVMDESMIPVKLYHTCVPRFDFSPSSVNLFCQKQLESWALLSQQDIKIKSCLKLKAQYINKQMILSHKIINAVWDRGRREGS